MSNDDQGLAEGESSVDPRILQNYLRKEIWRFEWEQKLARRAMQLVGFFYLMLVGFIFLGNGRFVFGKWYVVLSFKSHAATDIPIILALASIPTVLLIALMRYFHHREKASEGQDSPLPLSMQTAKDLLDIMKDQKQ
ncbi:hypothetical protein [Pseudomonas sp. 273]|uniref:hypothetical protein n=1 Tax=Pseudomonas sp. 273 TaxID=75692 RepID=UPI0023D874AD|nr:hypothetical protein [Pseudomonas sp. 273]